MNLHSTCETTFDKTKGLWLARYSAMPILHLTAPAAPEDRAATMTRTWNILRNNNQVVITGERAGSIKVGYTISMILALRAAPPFPFLFLEDDAAPTTVLGNWCGWPDSADLVYLGYAARHPKGEDLVIRHSVSKGWWQVRGGLLTSHALLFVTQRAVDIFKASCIVGLERGICGDAMFAESQHTLNVFAPTVPSFVQWSVAKPHNYTNTREHLNFSGKADVRQEIVEGW